jgi:hypothetical protein
MKLEGAGLRFLVYKCGRHSLSHLLGSDLSSTKSLRYQLPRISSQFLRITLLLQIHRFRLLDQRHMPLRPRSDRCPKRYRTADGSRLEPDVWFHRLTILYRLIHIKNGKRLRNGNKKGVIGDKAARTDAAAVSEDEVARVWLGGVRWRGFVAGGTETHWGWVDGRVVGEPPA